MLLLLWRSHSPKQRWLGPQAPPPQMVLPASATVIPAIIMSNGTHCKRSLISFTVLGSTCRTGLYELHAVLLLLLQNHYSFCYTTRLSAAGGIAAVLLLHAWLYSAVLLHYFLLCCCLTPARLPYFWLC